MNSLKRTFLSSLLMLIALSPGAVVRAEPPPGEGGPPPGEGAAPPQGEAPKTEEKEKENREKPQRQEQPPQEQAPPPQQQAPPREDRREERREERRQERREEAPRQEPPPGEQPRPPRDERREAPRERIQEPQRDPVEEPRAPREERRRENVKPPEETPGQDLPLERPRRERPKDVTPPEVPKAEPPKQQPQEQAPKEVPKETPEETPKSERERPKDTIAPGEPAPGTTPPDSETKPRERGSVPEGAPANGGGKPPSREGETQAPPAKQGGPTPPPSQTPPAAGPSSAPEQGPPDAQRDEGDRRNRDRNRNREGRGDGSPGQEQGKAPPQTGAEPAGSGLEQPRKVPEGEKLREIPKDEAKAREVLKEERLRSDSEFEAARRQIEQQQRQPQPAPQAQPQRQGGPTRQSGPGAAPLPPPPPRIDEQAITRFQDMRRQRRERVERGGVAVIEEPGNRVIVREADRSFIRHNEQNRLSRSLKEGRRERRPDGSSIIVNLGPNGLQIITVEDREGRLLRRSRRYQDGREVVLFDNRSFYNRMRDRPGPYVNGYVNLPPPVVRIPRRKYVVDYESASYDDIYEALTAPPIERIRRSYSLEEVRQSYSLRQRMRRIDLDAINFAFASWEVDPDQYPTLERIAEAMSRAIDRNPDEVFLIEGHTDAVGSDIDNLSLSDRRAEEVAIILSDTFRVPPENLVTQGYGEQFLKVPTEGPSWQNRRVAVRRITPLLARQSRAPEPGGPYDGRDPYGPRGGRD